MPRGAKSGSFTTMLPLVPPIHAAGGMKVVIELVSCAIAPDA
jgi:hypothetical protein